MNTQRTSHINSESETLQHKLIHLFGDIWGSRYYVYAPDGHLSYVLKRAISR
ncbi:hypothetical protein M422DRAFT_276390 [Sphaerobolus stellatus SS14]|uniref:Uncharacterized protein n=1 Tax=Sphaerobolus stellatus (strain SS14) TaxID=990650 RepID=A0A0C9UCB1_SPHS4|nr:hypothetical protein M422DRAFT_276390 [Sphaerobolus stellatus SS14]